MRASVATVTKSVSRVTDSTERRIASLAKLAVSYVTCAWLFAGAVRLKDVAAVAKGTGSGRGAKQAASQGIAAERAGACVAEVVEVIAGETGGSVGAGLAVGDDTVAGGTCGIGCKVRVGIACEDAAFCIIAGGIW